MTTLIVCSALNGPNTNNYPFTFKLYINQNEKKKHWVKLMLNQKYNLKYLNVWCKTGSSTPRNSLLLKKERSFVRPSHVKLSLCWLLTSYPKHFHVGMVRLQSVTALYNRPLLAIKPFLCKSISYLCSCCFLCNSFASSHLLIKQPSLHVGSKEKERFSLYQRDESRLQHHQCVEGRTVKSK